MIDVVLLYQRDCPNVTSARSNLMRAFSKAGVSASWREVDLDGQDTPTAWRHLGSPTILVDGVDVADGAPGNGATCRVYAEDGGLSGAPSVDVVAACLARGAQPKPASSAAPPSARPRPRSLASLFAALPGIGVALLPKGLCPACWPAYAAVLSALGLGFLMQDRYLPPLTLAFLCLATFALAYRARTRRGFMPAIVGGVAGLVFLGTKFALDVPTLAYLALGAFTVAALWNAWPIRRPSCPACVVPSTSASLHP